MKCSYLDRMVDYKFTEYFEKEVLRKRPYLKKEWRIQVIQNPVKSEATQGRLLHGLESFSSKDDQVIRSSLEKVARLMEIQDTKATFFFSEE